MTTKTPPLPNATDVNGDGEDPGEDEEQQLFDLQLGSPTRMHAWSHGCDWLGVAGQVFDRSGQPAEGILVEAGGQLAGEEILGLSITGMVDLYGPGGYEIQFQAHPVFSSNSIWIQLKDRAGQPISKKICLETRDDCNQNLILLNFVQVDSLTEELYFFPLVTR
jgi:hypothetical protein